MFSKIKNGITKGWKWLSGKKRWIAIAAGLLAKVTPEHTLGHQVGTFLKENSETVFEIVGGIAVVEAVAQKAKEKLPSGLLKK